MRDSRKNLQLWLVFCMLCVGGALLTAGPARGQAPPKASPAPTSTPQPPRADEAPDPLTPTEHPRLPPASTPGGSGVQMPTLPPGPLFLDPQSMYSQQRSIETALARSPLMQVSREKVARAIGSYRSQQANKNLQFLVNDNVYVQQAQRSGIRVSGYPSPITTDPISTQFSATMQVLLTTFGALENKIAAALLDIDVANRDYDVDRRSLILSTKQAFFYHLKAAASVATAQLNLENCLQNLSDSRQLFQQGLLSRYDVVQAELQVTQAEQRVAQGRTDMGTTRATYLATLYLPDATPFRLLPPTPIVVDPTLTPDTLKRVAVEHRPELKSYDRQLAVAHKLLAAAKSQSLPNLTASLGYQTYPGSRVTVQDNLVVQLTFTWTALDGGTRKAQVAMATAELRSLEAKMEQQRVQIRLQVEQAWLNYQQTLYNLRTAIKQVETAAVYYDMARQRYLNSLGTSLETQDALRSLNEARINLVSATFDRDLAFAQLEQSLGMDFPDRHLVLPPTVPQGGAKP